METAIASIRYGAPELKRVAHRYAGVGLTIALVFHLAGVGAFWMSRMLTYEEQKAPTRIMITDLGPPPTIRGEALPRMEISPGMLKPTAGVPVPVPDARVSPDRTIVDQRTLGEIVGPSIPGNGEFTVARNSEPAADDVPPPIFRPFEKPPEIVKQVLPKYPELAIKVGLEGRVYVRVWVDKEGKPRKAVVIKSDAEIFNQSAIDAAMQYRFTPAMMNKGPVSVWMTIPFVFRLRH